MNNDVQMRLFNNAQECSIGNTSAILNAVAQIDVELKAAREGGTEDDVQRWLNAATAWGQVLVAQGAVNTKIHTAMRITNRALEGDTITITTPPVPEGQAALDDANNNETETTGGSNGN